jgi:hypothetical protein
MKSLKHKLLEKRVDGSWVVCDTSDTIEELCKKGSKVLCEHYCKKPGIDYLRDENVKYMNAVREVKDEVYKPLEKKVLVLIQNSKKTMMDPPVLSEPKGSTLSMAEDLAEWVYNEMKAGRLPSDGWLCQPTSPQSGRVEKTPH